MSPLRSPRHRAHCRLRPRRRALARVRACRESPCPAARRPPRPDRRLRMQMRSPVSAGSRTVPPTARLGHRRASRRYAARANDGSVRERLLHKSIRHQARPLAQLGDASAAENSSATSGSSFRHCSTRARSASIRPSSSSAAGLRRTRMRSVVALQSLDLIANRDRRRRQHRRSSSFSGAKPSTAALARSANKCGPISSCNS